MSRYESSLCVSQVHTAWRAHVASVNLQEAECFCRHDVVVQGLFADCWQQFSLFCGVETFHTPMTNITVGDKVSVGGGYRNLC